MGRWSQACEILRAVSSSSNCSLMRVGVTGRGRGPSWVLCFDNQCQILNAGRDEMECQATSYYHVLGLDSPVASSCGSQAPYLQLECPQVSLTSSSCLTPQQSRHLAPLRATSTKKIGANSVPTPVCSSGKLSLDKWMLQTLRRVYLVGMSPIFQHAPQPVTFLYRSGINSRR